jgi:hypothetical protein
VSGERETEEALVPLNSSPVTESTNKNQTREEGDDKCCGLEDDENLRSKHLEFY